MKQLYMIALFLLVNSNAMHANEVTQMIQIDQNGSQDDPSLDELVNDNRMIFIAKNWLAQSATTEQKNLIIHIKDALSNQRAFILKEYNLEVFNTFPQYIRAHLKNTYPNICGIGIRDCDSLPEQYEKPTSIDRGVVVNE